MMRLIPVALWLMGCLIGASQASEPVIDSAAAWQTLVHKRAVKLSSPEDLNRLVTMAAERDLVLLGEATHGSHEFYVWRDRLSRRLISEQGFDFVAVEGDSAALARLDDYVQGRSEGTSSAAQVLRTFTRWPAWMWRNQEFAEFVEWLRTFNLTRPPEARVGVLGFDIYDPWSAADASLALLQRHRPDGANEFAARLACFTQLGGSDESIAKAPEAEQCRLELSAAEATLHADVAKWPAAMRYRYEEAVRHLRVVRNALEYYRTQSGTDSWNLRANHMWQTLAAQIEGGRGRRGIVWAHNSHIGDAYYTGLGDLGMHNIGQLSRQALGALRVFSIGLATSEGSAIAAPAWGETPSVTAMAPARADSLEALMLQGADVATPNWWLLFGPAERDDIALNQTLGHRGIGVVYQPEQDALYYLPTRMPWRYDALIYLRETTPLQPLE